jgi:hypothetical protein
MINRVLYRAFIHCPQKESYVMLSTVKILHRVHANLSTQILSAITDDHGKILPTITPEAKALFDQSTTIHNLWRALLPKDYTFNLRLRRQAQWDYEESRHFRSVDY